MKLIKVRLKDLELNYTNAILFAAVEIIGTPQALAKKVSPYEANQSRAFGACSLLLPNPCYPPRQHLWELNDTQ
jgi:hypothetical protein